MQMLEIWSSFTDMVLGMDDEGYYINDYFIDEVLRGQESISQAVMHFGNDLLKKKTALPMFHVRDCKSIVISVRRVCASS